MVGYLVRMAITALGLWLASEVVPSMGFEDFGALVAAALLLGIANAVVRPIAILLTLPITILTLGLFLFVVNAGMLWLVSALLPGFWIGGLLPALVASLIVGATSWVASWYIGPSGRFEVLVIDERS